MILGRGSSAGIVPDREALRAPALLLHGLEKCATRRATS